MEGTLGSGAGMRRQQPRVTVTHVFLAVHGQLWGRRAEQVGAVPGGGPAGLGLFRTPEARSLPGLQHALLPRRGEER